MPIRPPVSTSASGPLSAQAPRFATANASPRRADARAPPRAGTPQRCARCPRSPPRAAPDPRARQATSPPTSNQPPNPRSEPQAAPAPRPTARHQPHRAAPATPGARSEISTAPDLGQPSLDTQPMQPQSQIPSADKTNQYRPGRAYEQLKLPERLRRTQLLQVIQHQPDPPIQSAQARQQALGQPTSIKTRRRRQVPDQPRPSARAANCLPDRQPEAKGIPLLNPNRDPRSPIGEVHLSDPTADQRRLPAPSRTGNVDHTSRPTQHLEQPTARHQTAGPAHRTSNTHPDSMLDHEHIMQATTINGSNSLSISLRCEEPGATIAAGREQSHEPLVAQRAATRRGGRLAGHPGIAVAGRSAALPAGR